MLPTILPPGFSVEVPTSAHPCREHCGANRSREGEPKCALLLVALHFCGITLGDPFGGPPICILDECIQIRNTYPPYAPAADLDSAQLAGLHHGPDERYTHVQFLSNLFDCEEAQRSGRFVGHRLIVWGAQPRMSGLRDLLGVFAVKVQDPAYLGCRPFLREPHADRPGQRCSKCLHAKNDRNRRRI